MRTFLLALPLDGADPNERLAGLSLALRGVLVLQSLGATRVGVVVSSRDRALVDAMRGDARVRVPLDVLVAPDPSRPLAALAGVVGDGALVLPHDVVCDVAILRALVARATTLTAGDAIGVAACDDRGPVGPLVVTEALLARASTVKSLVASGEVVAMPIGARWLVRIDGPASKRRAFDLLFEACRKPIDGIVSRNLNRHVSIAISKRLVETGVTPNMMSAATFLVGVAAAWSASRGGYGPILLGAFLLQWNSILDGVDGELARVRFQHSRLGQWVDTVCDDATNVLFWAALAIGARSTPHGLWLEVTGLVAAVANLLFAAITYVDLVAMGTGDVLALEWSFKKSPKATLAGKALVALSYIPKKDFFIFFCLVMAFVGVLPWMLPAIALGALVSLVANARRSLARTGRGAALAAATTTR
jgi:phosphatidylglycerophosphate synthase